PTRRSSDLVNGVDVSGETGSTFTSTTLADGDVVSVVMTSNDLCADPITANASASAVVVSTSVTPSVAITGGPAGSICSGSSVTYTANPTNGGTTPTYQWQVNGADVPGETGSTFTSTTLADGDVVSVVMTSNDPCADPITANASAAPVTMSDTENPTFISCPNNIVVDAVGACSADVNWIAPTATDNCQVASVSSSHQPGATFPVGTTTVVYTAVDGAG